MIIAKAAAVSVGPKSPLIAPVVARLYSSDVDVKFLDSLDTARMKRGKGFRSSFSGTVATVFGATGFLGKFVANRLGACGTQMIFPYRCDAYMMKHLKPAGDLGQCLFTEFHLRDEESIRRAVRHSHVVINLIGREFETRNFTYHEANAEGAARLARISKEMGVKRFIHLSAMNCDRDHKGYLVKGGSKFLKSKGEGEKMVLKEFPEAVIIRPAEMFGYADNSDRLIWYIIHWFRLSMSEVNWAYRVPLAGRGVFKQPIYGGDVAQAIVNAAIKDMGEPGQIYQAVGKRRYEWRDLIDWVLRVTRRAGAFDLPDTRIADVKYQPLLLLQAYLNELFIPFQYQPKGNVIFDRLERETVSDLVDPDLPLINELGVETLEPIEGRGAHCAEMGALYMQVRPYPGEWPELYPAKFTEPHELAYS